MKRHLSPEEIARSHRWHAIECNNLAWKLSDQAGRTPAEDEEMLDTAHASAFHWAKVGTELNHARAKMLLAHVHAALGAGRTALAYAQKSFEYLAAHEAPDWEIAFAHAILAHAAFAAGDAGLHQQHHARAQELGQAIADIEDREIFFKTFDRIPRPRRLGA
jgi:hypothetical protein